MNNSQTILHQVQVSHTLEAVLETIGQIIQLILGVAAGTSCYMLYRRPRNQPTSIYIIGVAI